MFSASPKRARFQLVGFSIKLVVEIFIFLPDSVLPSERQDLKPVSLRQNTLSECTHQFPQTFAKFYECELAHC